VVVLGKEFMLLCGSIEFLGLSLLLTIMDISVCAMFCMVTMFLLACTISIV